MEMIRKYKNFILPLLLASCCVLGTLVQGVGNSSKSESEVVTEKATALPTYTPQPEPTAEPTVDTSKEDCRTEIVLWNIEISNVLQYISLATKALNNNQDMMEYMKNILEAKQAYEKIVAPTCDNAVRNPHFLLGLTVKSMSNFVVAIAEKRENDAMTEMETAQASLSQLAQELKNLHNKYDIK